MKFRNLWDKFTRSKTALLFIGIAATLWFLIRVIPKPSRARYPCMQAAAPLMSSFIIYLLSLGSTWFSFKKFKHFFHSSKYLQAALFLFVAAFSFSIVFVVNHKDSIARVLNPVDDTFPIPSNAPVGVAQGLFPGRVVWVQDENATNEYYVPTRNSDDYWYSDLNVDEEVVKEMLSTAIMKYAGKDNITEAWDAIFKAYNNSHGRGDVGYTSGEKIAFKINLTNQSCSTAERPLRMDVAPQLLNAILHELVDNVGVAEKDITMGDPYREFRKEYRDLVMSKFPDVYYVDGYGNNGIHQTVPSTNAVLKFSDKRYQSTLPQQYLNATYIINIPALKTHNEGGITLIAKNHQGSYLTKGKSPNGQSAMDMHYCLPASNRGTKKYRHTVDYMGHMNTGGKGLIYIIDGLWGGESWEGWIKKFKSEPFNDDYPNSIFVGQDPVALESVCYDILFQEYVEDDSKNPYPITYKTEISDYLLQCASSDYWPSNIQYDPEGDGTPIGSLGVFEHWNNANERLYTRNLGTGDGIELKYLKNGVSGIKSKPVKNISIAAPNPFSAITTFNKPVDISGNSELEIYNSNGMLIRKFSFSETTIKWNATNANNDPVPSGLYVYKIHDKSNNSVFTGKIILKK